MKTFIEIGSCDFNTLNYLADHGWRGVIVEPVEEYINNLERKQNVQYMCCVVGEKLGVTKFYRWLPDIIESDHDFRGMSRIEPKSNEHMNNMIETEVPMITYDALLKMNNISRVDFLKIDTEGYDFRILQTVDFNSHIRPKVIKVEHAHCGAQPIIDLLTRNNYHVELEQNDIYAIDLGKN